MTQFKDKSARHADNINAGLFTYPCLMAADILLYNADYVPVGHDQKQHVELARDIAERFNNLYSPTFTVPEVMFGKAGARVMSLQDPTKKIIDIYSGVTGKSYEEIEREFEGKGYGDFKTAVGEAVVEELRPVQEKYARLIKDKAYLEACWHEGAPKAEAVARRTLQKVMRKVGYLS